MFLIGRESLTQLVPRDFPEGSQLVAFQLKEIALLALPFHFVLQPNGERLQLVTGHCRRVHAIDDGCDLGVEEEEEELVVNN